MIVETSGITSLYLEPGHITTSILVEDEKEWYRHADLRKVAWLKFGFHMLA